MASIRDVVGKRAAYDTYQRVFARGLPGIEYRDRQDESSPSSGGGARSTHNIQKRGIQRLLDLEQSAYEAAFGAAPHRAQTYMQSFYMTETQPPYAVSLESGNRSWYRQRRDDIANNTLYDQWLKQRLYGYKTYPCYCVACAAKALIELVTAYPDAERLCRELAPERDPPSKAACLTAKQSAWYTDPEAFFTHIFNVVDVAWIEIILLRYGDLVRGLQRQDGTESPKVLPDDPFGEADLEVSEADRIELAFIDLAAGQGTADQIARRYGIGQKKFRLLARERGVLGSHGGYRHTKRG